MSTPTREVTLATLAAPRTRGRKAVLFAERYAEAGHEIERTSLLRRW